MDVVTFAVEFADYAHHTLQISGGGRHSAAQIAATAECIALTRRWIADSGSVTPDELYRAVAGRGVRRSAVDAAYLAAAISEGDVTLADLHNPAHAAAAADAADAAAYVAYLATYIPYGAAVHDAHAYNAAYPEHMRLVARVTRKSKDGEYARQGQFILKYLRGV